MPGKRIVLCTFGTLGDLHPFIALARELKRRGHFPVVATTATYRARVEAAGAAFHPVRPDIDLSDPAMLRRAVDRWDGARYIACELIFPYLREAYEDTVAAARDADLLVTHALALSAFLLAQKANLPWVSVALAPVGLFSVHDPCVFGAFPFCERLATFGPRFQRGLMRTLEFLFEPYWKPFRAFERELGLPHTQNPILFGYSPQLVLGLFSPHLAAPQPDWPPNAHATGFPFFEHDEGNSPELQRFLNAGDPPIVFTLGSGAVGAADDFFRHSIEAARRLGRRAVLLVGHYPANQPAQPLPPGILAVPYAPHAAVFPRACAVVHPGGIGTTGEAMRAGRPMLVIPYSHDQPDHAYRLKRMGVARSIARGKYTAAAAVREIEALLSDQTYAQRAANLGARVRAETGTQTACDLLEQLLATGSTTPRLSETAAVSSGKN